MLYISRMGSMTEHIQINKFCHVLSPRFEQNIDLSAGEDGDGHYSSGGMDTTVVFL